MEVTMSKVLATLTYIKGNPIDIFTMITAMIAATLVASGVPQPYFGMAFWLYVVSALSACVMNYKRANYAYAMLFGYYVMIDTYGIFNWWPWKG